MQYVGYGYGRWQHVNDFLQESKARRRLRAVGKSENPGVPVLLGGHNLPFLVEMGLTDLPKSGGAMAPPAPQGTTGLRLWRRRIFPKQDRHVFLQYILAHYCYR